MKNIIIQYLGIEQYQTGHAEKLISGLGAFFGIFAVFYTSSYFVQGTASYIIVASMGASSVLLFAVPHGPLSQPWSVIGGHLFSAAAGITAVKFIPDIYLAAAIGTGVAVSAMYYFHCIHPPGGATALSAVVVGHEMQQISYQYILTPVLINVIAILSVALIFNNLFKSRRYPAHLALKQSLAKKSKTEQAYGSITHEDFVYALSELDTFIDISENELLRIYDLVTKRQRDSAFSYQELKNGHYYSNGEYGDIWSVRQIVDWADADDSGEEKLIYKVIAGANRRNSDVMTKNEFARWAKYEVTRDEENWRRVDKSEQS